MNKTIQLSCILLLLASTEVFCAAHLVSVEQFGAVADAKRVGQAWIGTDNSAALNKCAAYCRKNGLVSHTVEATP